MKNLFFFADDPTIDSDDLDSPGVDPPPTLQESTTFSSSFDATPVVPGNNTAAQDHGGSIFTDEITEDIEKEDGSCFNDDNEKSGLDCVDKLGEVSAEGKSREGWNKSRPEYNQGQVMKDLDHPVAPIHSQELGDSGNLTHYLGSQEKFGSTGELFGGVLDGLPSEPIKNGKTEAVENCDGTDFGFDAMKPHLESDDKVGAEQSYKGGSTSGFQYQHGPGVNASDVLTTQSRATAFGNGTKQMQNPGSDSEAKGESATLGTFVLEGLGEITNPDGEAVLDVYDAVPKSISINERDSTISYSSTQNLDKGYHEAIDDCSIVADSRAASTAGQNNVFGGPGCKHVVGATESAEEPLKDKDTMKVGTQESACSKDFGNNNYVPEVKVLSLTTGMVVDNYQVSLDEPNDLKLRQAEQSSVTVVTPPTEGAINGIKSEPRKIHETEETLPEGEAPHAPGFPRKGPFDKQIKETSRKDDATATVGAGDMARSMKERNLAYKNSFATASNRPGTHETERKSNTQGGRLVSPPDMFLPTESNSTGFEKLQTEEMHNTDISPYGNNHGPPFVSRDGVSVKLAAGELRRKASEVVEPTSFCTGTVTQETSHSNEGFTGHEDRSATQSELRHGNAFRQINQHASQPQESLSIGTVHAATYSIRPTVPPGVKNRQSDDSDSISDSSSSSDSDSLSDTDASCEQSDRMDHRAASFDVDLLKRCMENGTPVLEQVQDRHVVMLLGKTGTGKSTLIQGLAGRRFQTIVHKSGSSRLATKDVFEAEDALPGFEIGHSKESETKFVKCFVTQSSSGDSVELAFVDSPGFEDTGGPEVDIATTVMIHHIVRVCKSVRFVVLVNYVSLLEDRGGAMRAALKWTTGFVDDFHRNKSSFMFLFTHSNEVKNVPDTLHDVRTHIYDELVRTMEGTHNETRDILDHLRKSLKRYGSKNRRRLVDVVHPLHTNFADLKAEIERMKPSKITVFTGGCGLTPILQLKLGNGLESLLRQLRLLLLAREMNNEKLKMVKGIVMSVHFLQRYMDIEPVRKSVSESGSLIKKQVALQVQVVNNELRRGTSNSSKFDTASIRDMRDALAKLRVFQQLAQGTSTDDTSTLLANVEESVTAYGETVREGGLDQRDLSQKLRNLSVWATFSQRLHKNYNNICKSFSLALQTMCDEAMELSSEPSFLSSVAVSKLAKGLHVLLSNRNSFRCLDGHTPVINKVNEAVHSSEKSLILTLEYWKSRLMPGGLNAQLDEAALWGKAIQTVQELQTFALISSDVFKVSDSTKDLLEHAAQQHFSGRFKYIKQLSPQSDKWCGALAHVKAELCHFSGLRGGPWEKLQREYHSVVEVIGAKIRKLVLDLERRAELVLRTGFSDNAGPINDVLKNVQRFDGFLLPEFRFVSDSVATIEQLHQQRVDLVGKQVETHLSALFDDSSDRLQAIDCLRRLWPEWIVISTLVDKKSESNLKSKDKISIYVRDVISRGKKLLSEWKEFKSRWEQQLNSPRCENLTKDTESKLYSARHALWEHLNHMKTLGLLDPACDSVLESIRKDILQSFNEFSTYLAKTAESQLRYKAKELSLVAVESFQSTSPVELPDFAKLRETVRLGVQAHADHIQQQILDGMDVEKINAALVRFDKAKNLDRFIGNEASSRRHLLQEIRDRKEGEVDENLRSLVSARDFRGIAALTDHWMPFLGPQLSKQQKNQISTCFKGIVQDVDCALAKCLDDEKAGQNVSSGLRELELASGHLGKVANKCGFQFDKEISALKGRVDGTIDIMLSKTQLAVDELDFQGIFAARASISAFIRPLKPLLKHKNLVSIQLAESNCKKVIDSSWHSLNSFLVSGLTDCSKMYRVLDCLQHCVHQEGLALYSSLTSTVTSRLNENFNTIVDDIGQRACHDEGIAWVKKLCHHLDHGLHRHLRRGDLCFDEKTVLEQWGAEKAQRDDIFEFRDTAENSKPLKEAARLLDQLHPSRWDSSNFYQLENDNSYTTLCRLARLKADQVSSKGLSALQRRDPELAQDCIEFLDVFHSEVGRHLDCVLSCRENLILKAQTSFMCFCEQAQQQFESGGLIAFERLFFDFRDFVLRLPCTVTSDEGKKSFSRVNQMVFEKLEQEVSELHELADGSDFLGLKQKLVSLRRSGGFIADRFSMLHEEVETSAHVSVDRWLNKIWSLSVTHFSCGRDLQRIKHYVRLGLPPSASRQEIEKAYRSLAGNEGTKSRETELKRVQEAFTELSQLESKADEGKPFDETILGLCDRLQAKVRNHLAEQRYGHVEELLYRLNQLNCLDELVTPSFNSDGACRTITDMVKNHVKKVQIEVDTNCSEHNYRALNDNINDLKMMEASFKAYPNVFPSSWNKGILGNIESEIEALGDRAKGYVESKAVARLKFDDFKRCFLRMGSVLTELPSFRDWTKSTMSSVLETCLSTDCGYEFLFEFGLSLQRGDESASDEENRIGQLILTEFSHFNDVVTMVWNEETCQRPVEQTLGELRAEQRSGLTTQELAIEASMLYSGFMQFETEYRGFLESYLSPEADINQLVEIVTGFAKSLGPVDCIGGWGGALKAELPRIVAGVFAAFTVLKSSASYNLIEDADLGEKILMKPHNIQVLTLLCMFGLGDSDSCSLANQVMQIRTGEGKSLILGVTAVVLALFGFPVRCICYSEYLSQRDYELFKDLFGRFQISDMIQYSKITTLSEQTTARKGDIRQLTKQLLRGEVSKTSSLATQQNWDSTKSEILVVDEFDVFFGKDFYGQTYNQVVRISGPEIIEILKFIWASSTQQGNRKQSVRDIQALEAYNRLLLKYPQSAFVLDTEIELMLDQVALVDNEPYHLDRSTGRIGYKVMDSIEYDVAYGYCTMFAYLKEADRGTLKDVDATLNQQLGMLVSCGQFSYANISPLRILGVSGTVDAMGNYEKNVLADYGIDRFVYVPSVYGESNFQFDAAGSGIFIESKHCDYFRRITEEIMSITKDKRAAIVLFDDNTRLKEFTRSTFYGKLGRHKRTLTEDMDPVDKDFVVKKASTAGQATVTTAVFGRGTDFFCKDEGVQKNGGVHIIQAFFSEQLSEEIQIKGRTARQGKKGSFQLILFEADLVSRFSVQAGAHKKVAKSDLYEWLCTARNDTHNRHCSVMKSSLENATKRDKDTHKYFDALIAGNRKEALALFKENYLSMKVPSLSSRMDIDVAFLIDLTGSMIPFAPATVAIIQALVDKQGVVMGKLEKSFPETEFEFRVALMGFRDIDDKSKQFEAITWENKGHFSENTDRAIKLVESLTRTPSGGGDIAEDWLGAIDRCARWKDSGDWTSRVKFMIVLTDAPAHGYASASHNPTLDSYSTQHPLGITPDGVVNTLFGQGIDLFICSFNPAATAATEQELSRAYLAHPNNAERRDISVVPLVSGHQPTVQTSATFTNKHIVFVLDESGSMSRNWAGVVVAYKNFMAQRLQHQCDTDLVSVVQFSGSARVTVKGTPIRSAPRDLFFQGGGTAFHPAAHHACEEVRSAGSHCDPLIVFMSDGRAGDAHSAAGEFASLHNQVKSSTGKDLELHVIAFGAHADQNELAEIARSSPIGKVRSSSDTSDLSKVFVEIAGGANIAIKLEAEIGKRVSDAVTKKLALEFLK